MFYSVMYSNVKMPRPPRGVLDRDRMQSILCWTDILLGTAGHVIAQLDRQKTSRRTSVVWFLLKELPPSVCELMPWCWNQSDLHFIELIVYSI